MAGGICHVADLEEPLSGSPSLDEAQNVHEGLGIPDRASPKGAPRGAGQRVGLFRPPESWRGICFLYIPPSLLQEILEKLKGLYQLTCTEGVSEA